MTGNSTPDPSDKVPPENRFDWVDIGNVVALVKMSADQTIPSGSETKIEFDTIDVEHSEIFDIDTANYTVTVLEDGIYLVNGVIRWVQSANWTTGDRAGFSIYLNGVKAVDSSYTLKIGTDYETQEYLHVLELSSGDTLALRAIQGSGADEDLDHRECYFQVVRIG